MVALIKRCYANKDAPAFILTNTNYSHSLSLSEALGDIKIQDLLKPSPVVVSEATGQLEPELKNL